MAIDASKTMIVLGQVDTILKSVAAKITASVPTKVTDLTDGANYSTTEQMNTAIAAAVAAAPHLQRKKVDSLDAIDPAAEGADKFIYMVPKTTPATGDEYDEYMVIDGKVEKVGNWAVDLTDYVQKEDGKGLSTNDYTTAEKDKLAGIAEGATKVTATEGSGTIGINGTDVALFRVATDEEFNAVLTGAGFTVPEA